MRFGAWTFLHPRWERISRGLGHVPNESLSRACTRVHDRVTSKSRSNYDDEAVYVSSDQIYCAWEERRFPRDQFESREGYGLVHSKDVDVEHTTSGELLDDHGHWPAPAAPAGD